jgi:hypothetical protein
MSPTVPSAWLEREYLALYDRRVDGALRLLLYVVHLATRDTILPKNRWF